MPVLSCLCRFVLAERAAEGRERKEFIISSRVNIYLVSANDVMQHYVMEHFAFPGNVDFAADDQRISCVIHERVMSIHL